MGGAQPLAITLNDGTAPIADCRQERLDKRMHDRYLDEIVEGLDAAIDRAPKQKFRKRSALAGAAPRWPCWNALKRGELCPKP